MSSRRQKRCLDPSEGAPVVWVKHGRTQHMAFLLEEKDDRVHIRWASNLSKEWVDASTVAFDVERRGTRRRGATGTPSPKAEDRAQRGASRDARSKLDPMDQGEDGEDEELDCSPGESADQDDEEEEAAEEAEQRRGKTENNQKSSEKMTGKRGNDSLFPEDDMSTAEGISAKEPKRPRTDKTPPGYRNPSTGEAVRQKKPAGMKSSERLDPVTMPPKAQANAKDYPVGYGEVLAGTSVAKRTEKKGWISGLVASVEGSICHVRWASGRDVELEKEEMAKLLYDADTMYYPVGTRVRKRFSSDSVKSGKVISLDDSLYHILYNDKTTEVVGTSEMDQIVKASGRRASSPLAIESLASESKTKIQTPGQSTGSESCATASGKRHQTASSTLAHKDNYGVEPQMTSSSKKPRIARETPTISSQLGIPKGDRLDVPSVVSMDEQSVGKLKLEKTRASNAQSEKEVKVRREPLDPPADDEIKGVTPQAGWNRQEHLSSSFSPKDTPSRIKSIASQLQKVMAMARGCLALPALDSTYAKMESSRIANDPPPLGPVVAKDPPSLNSEKPQTACAVNPTEDEGENKTTAVVNETDRTVLEDPTNGDNGADRTESIAPAAATSLDSTMETVAEVTSDGHMFRIIAQTEEQPHLASSKLQDVDKKYDVRGARESTQDSLTGSTAATGEKAQALHLDRAPRKPQDKDTSNESTSDGGLGEIGMVLACNSPTMDGAISVPLESVGETKEEDSDKSMTGPVFAGNKNDTSFANDQAKDASLPHVGTAATVHKNNPDQTPLIALDQDIDVKAATDVACAIDDSHDEKSTLLPWDVKAATDVAGAIGDSHDEKSTLLPLDAADSVPKIQPGKAPLIRVDQAAESHPTKDSAESPVQSGKLVEPPTDVRSISEVNNEKPNLSLYYNSSSAVAPSVATRRRQAESNEGEHARPSRSSAPKQARGTRLPLAGAKRFGKPIPKALPTSSVAATKRKVSDGPPNREKPELDNTVSKRHRAKTTTKTMGKVQSPSLDYSKLYPRTQGNDDPPETLGVRSHLLEPRRGPFLAGRNYGLSQEARAKRSIMSVLLSRPPDRKNKAVVTQKAAETSDKTSHSNATPTDCKTGPCTGKVTIRRPAQNAAPEERKMPPKEQPTPPFGMATTQGQGMAYPPGRVRNMQPVETRASANSGSFARQPWNPSATPVQPNYWGYGPAFGQQHPNASRGAPTFQGGTSDPRGRSAPPTSGHTQQSLAFLRQKNPALYYGWAQAGLAASMAPGNRARAANPYGTFYGPQAPAAGPVYGMGQHPFPPNSAASLTAYFASNRPRQVGKGDPPAPHVNQVP